MYHPSPHASTLFSGIDYFAAYRSSIGFSIANKYQKFLPSYTETKAKIPGNAWTDINEQNFLRGHFVILLIVSCKIEKE